jgi:uncharacterized membrane protein YbhN (UPF0104 family)
MSVLDITMNMPWWYWLVLVVFSLYYAVRGIIEQKISHRGDQRFSQTEKVIYFYIQEFLFKVIITTSGFIALSTANYIFLSLKSPSDIGAGTAVLLIFLIFWGVTGISGYLTLLIVSGKFPALK